MGAIEGIAGILLAFIGATFFIFATPSLMSVVETGAGTTWENSSTFIVNGLEATGMFIGVLPFLILLIGLAISVKGFSGG